MKPLPIQKIVPELCNKVEYSQEEPRIILYNVSWEQYETIADTFMDCFPALRMTYLEGILQIMTISTEHERLKTIIARLLEIYALEKDIDLNGYGSATFRKQAKARGLEPDECYCLGELKEVPDIAIEIVITSGGIDKLEAYRGLEVPEVWFWQDNQFSIHALQNDIYQTVTHSHLLLGLDLEHLKDYISWTNQTQAVKAYRATIN